MLAIMPMDDIASLDRNLEYSVHGIKQIKQYLNYDIFFWYCSKDVPPKDDANACNPLKIVEILKKQYEIWSPEIG